MEQKVAKGIYHKAKAPKMEGLAEAKCQEKTQPSHSGSGELETPKADKTARNEHDDAAGWWSNTKLSEVEENVTLPYLSCQLLTFHSVG